MLPIRERRGPRLRSLVALSLLLSVVLATPVLARGPLNDDADEQIVLSGGVNVEAGERVGDVFVFHGSATIAGEVRGSVTVFDGPVSVSGSVSDDVTAFHGRVTVESTATINGDVRSEQPASVADGAEIGGEVTRLHLAPALLWIRIGFWLAYAISVLALGLLLILLVPRALDAAAQVAWARVWPSIGWGLVLFFGLPAVGVLILITIVGAPLGVAVLLALLLVYTLGHTLGAWALGRRLLKPPRGRVASFVVGWAIVEAFALIPFVGGVVWIATTVFGLGALTLAWWRSRKGASVPVPEQGALPV